MNDNPKEISNKLINKICNYFSSTASLNLIKEGSNLGNSTINLPNNQNLPEKTISNKFYHLILKCR